MLFKLYYWLATRPTFFKSSKQQSNTRPTPLKSSKQQFICLFQLYIPLQIMAGLLFSLAPTARENRPKFIKNHKMERKKNCLLCSEACYGQNIMSRSLHTKTTFSSKRSFWYIIVLGEIGLIFEQICKRWGGLSK